MEEHAVLRREDSSERWELSGRNWRQIGRGADLQKGDILLTDRTASKHHARVQCMGGFFLEDLDSRNGTKINGKRIPPGEKTELCHGDIISFGKETFLFEIHRGKELLPELFGMRGFWQHGTAGRQLGLYLGDAAVIDYQMKMIEKNPTMGIPFCRHIRSIRGDQLIYETQGMRTISEYMKEIPLNTGTWNQILLGVILAVRKGEAHLLFKEQYTLTPETVLLTPGHNLLENMKIIYIPAILRREYDFKENFCAFALQLSQRIPKEDASVPDFLDALRQGGNTTEDILRMLSFYKTETERRKGRGQPGDDEPKTGETYKKTRAEAGKKEKGKSRWTEEIPFHISRFFRVWKIPVFSYALFLAVFWWEVLNGSELVGLAIALTGLNVYLLRKKEEESEEE